MAESLMQMYETMTATAQQELYDFALFLLSKEKSIKNYLDGKKNVRVQKLCF